METISAYFDELDRRGYEPLLAAISATIRWDILDGEGIEHRVVRIERGHLSSEIGDVPADCVITADRAVCEDLVTGRSTSLAAVLRGAAAVDGDPRLAVLAQRLFRSQRATTPGLAGLAAEGRTP